MAVLSILGTALGVAGNVASGIMSVVNNKKAKAQQEAEDARRIAYHEARANEDPFSRASNRQLLNEYDRRSQKQLDAARGVAAITGATPEYTLAIQKGIAEGRAGLMGDISVANEARADAAENNAEKAREQAAANRLALIQERNKAYANLAANAGNVAKSLISSTQPKGDFYGGDEEEKDDKGATGEAQTS